MLSTTNSFRIDDMNADMNANLREHIMMIGHSFPQLLPRMIGFDDAAPLIDPLVRRILIELPPPDLDQLQLDVEVFLKTFALGP